TASRGTLNGFQNLRSSRLLGYTHSLALIPLGVAPCCRVDADLSLLARSGYIALAASLDIMTSFSSLALMVMMRPLHHQALIGFLSGLSASPSSPLHHRPCGLAHPSRNSSCVPFRVHAGVDPLSLL